MLLLRIGCAVVLSYMLVAAYLRVARRRSILDVPNHRSSHSVPTPRGGGLALVAAALAVHALDPRPAWALMAAAATICGVGFFDDLKGLSSAVRLLVQVGTAAFLLLTAPFGTVVELPVVGEFGLGWFAVPCWLFWVVGFSNAFNFMDGIDGIAGGQAAVALVGWSLAVPEHVGAGGLALLFAAASVGFLGHNWSPAKVFMGDSGSVTLGLILAELTVWQSARDPRLLFFGVSAVLPFLVDATATLIRRALKGERILEAHRTHCYQRLVQSGLSHGVVATLYIAAAALSTITGLAWLHRHLGDALGVVALGCVAVLPYVVLWTRAHSVRAR